MTSYAPCNLATRQDHIQLIERRRDFLYAAVALVRSVVPETLEFWCYGINALRPHAPTKDWDFIAFVPNTVGAEQIEALNGWKSPLSELHEIAKQRLDVEVMHIGSATPCARIVRAEGFCVWRKPMRLHEASFSLR